MRELVKPGRYAMFLRKSREDIEAERSGKFETLAKHEAVLNRLADDMGLSVAHVYRELASGASLVDREQAMEMLSDVRSGAYDGVLAFDLQRITRGDMIDQGSIQRVFALTDTPIITPAKVYDMRDELDGNFVELEMLFGRMELARITKRMTAGKEEAVRQGQYIGSIAPFGWDKVQDGRMKTLAPNGDNPRMVSWYERIADDEATPREIADEMNELGIPSPRGKMWDRSLVLHIIQNPVNKGYVRWNQRKTVTSLDGELGKVKRRQPTEPVVAKGLHEGTVSEELWQRANDVISSRANHKTPKKYELKDPLASLLVCKCCGRSMLRAYNSNSPTEYYVHSRVNRRCCWQHGSKIGDVVDLLVEALEEAAEDIELCGEPERGTSSTPQLEKDLQAERGSVETLFRLVERGIITDDEFAERKRLSDKRLEAIEAKLSASKRADREAAGARITSAALKEAVASLRDYKGRAQQVNDCLKALVSRIEYEKDPETGKIHLGVIFK